MVQGEWWLGEWWLKDTSVRLTLWMMHAMMRLMPTTVNGLPSCITCVTSNKTLKSNNNHIESGATHKPQRLQARVRFESLSQPDRASISHFIVILHHMRYQQ